jgi:hypothetical protein
VKAPEVLKPPEPKASKLFAVNLRKEQALQARRTELAAKEAEVSKKYAELEAWNASRASAKVNPIKALEAMGLTYEQVTNFMLNGGVPSADVTLDLVQKKLDDFTASQNAERSKAQEAEKARLAAEDARVENEYVENVNKFISSNAEKYELINTFGQSQMVIDVIKANWEQHKRLLNETEAADLVESHLLEQIESATHTKKWQARVAPVTPAPVASKPEAPPEASSRMQRALAVLGGTTSATDTKEPVKTLSNGLTSSVGMAHQSLTPAQRRERAIARLSGKNL